jgi:hypothetical protein
MKTKLAAAFSGALIIIFLVFAVFNYLDKNPETKSNSVIDDQIVTPATKPLIVMNDRNENSLIFPVLLPEKSNVTQSGSRKFPLNEIHPPVKELAVRLVSHEVNAQVGEEIKTSYGSRIIVPKNAFLDSEGNIFRGEATVLHREFHDRASIFFSGIPMHYDSAAGYVFESAGMFELRAEGNGKPLNPNPASPITVMMNSASKENGYNIYYFNEKTSAWAYLEPSTVLPEKVRSSSPSKEIAKPVLPDSIKAVQRTFSNQKYSVSLTDRGMYFGKRKYLIFGRKEADFFLFSFSKNAGSFPETKAFSGVSFMYEGNDANALYTYLRKVGLYKRNPALFTNFSLEQLSEKDFHLTFVSDSGKIEITVQPFLLTEKDKYRFSKALAIYTGKLNDRKMTEDKTLAQFQKDTAEYYARYGRYEYTSARFQNVALRPLQVNGFGIYNCDRPYMPETAKTVFAEFYDDIGNKLMFATGYMVDKKRNSVYTVNDFAKFRFSPDSSFLFFAVLPGNQVGLITKKEFSRHRSDEKKSVFTMLIDKDAIKSEADFKKLILKANEEEKLLSLL